MAGGRDAWPSYTGRLVRVAVREACADLGDVAPGRVAVVVWEGGAVFSPATGLSEEAGRCPASFSPFFDATSEGKREAAQSAIAVRASRYFLRPFFGGTVTFWAIPAHRCIGVSTCRSSNGRRNKSSIGCCAFIHLLCTIPSTAFAGIFGL